MADKQSARILAYVRDCVDAQKLRQVAINARKQGNIEVERQASLRLYQVLPSSDPDTFEFDVWKSIHALEDTLTIERCRTTRLQRTRNAIKDESELATVKKLLMKASVSEGFGMLRDRRMLDLTFEAVALRHPELFSDEELSRARQRLQKPEKF